MRLRYFCRWQEICKLQMVSVPYYWSRTSLSFRGGLAFWRGTQRPCLQFTSDTTSHCIPRRSTQHQDQEQLTLLSDSRRGPVQSVTRQAQEIFLQIEQELFVTHGVAKPVHGVSTCSFCVSFGRDWRTPPVSAENGNDRKRWRKPSLHPGSTSAFPRARIEEH
jgi:hypothetical protein